MGGPRTREKGQAERPGGGGAGSPSGRSAGAGGAGSRGRGALRGPGESARTPGGPGERPGSRGWRAAATYLLVRDPRRLLQAEGAAVGAVLRHHAQAAGRAHQLLGVAARGHLGGHDAAGALARCPPPAARSPARAPREPRPAPPAWLTAPASSRQARLRARTNRCSGSAPPPRAPIGARAPPPPLRPATNGQREPSQARPAPSGRLRLRIGQSVGDVGSSSLLIGASGSGRPALIGGEAARGGAVRRSSRSAGEVRTRGGRCGPGAAGGRGGFGHRDRWGAGRARLGARAALLLGFAAGAGWRLPSAPIGGAQPRTGRRDRGARAPAGPGRWEGAGRMPSRDGTEGLGPGAVSPRSCRACSGCASAPGARGGARRVGSGRAQSVPGGKRRCAWVAGRGCSVPWSVRTARAGACWTCRPGGLGNE